MLKLNKSYMLVFMAAVLWGCLGVFSKTLMSAGFTSIQVVSVRVTVAAVIYTVFLLIKDPAKLRVRLRDMYYFIGTGVVSLVFFNWCYFGAIEESSMAASAVLLYTAPIFVSVMSALLFKERLTGVKLIALVVAFAGCSLVTGVLHDAHSVMSLKAVLLGLGAGIGYALYSIFSKFALRKYQSETITVYTFITASIVSLPLAFSTGTAMANISVDAVTVICALLLGSVFSVLPYLLYTKGLQRIEAGKASIIATCEPVVASLLGVIVFREGLELPQAAGIILVLGAVVLLNLCDSKKTKISRREL